MMLIAQWVKGWLAGLAVLNSITDSGNLFNHTRGSIAHSI